MVSLLNNELVDGLIKKVAGNPGLADFLERLGEERGQVVGIGSYNVHGGSATIGEMVMGAKDAISRLNSVGRIEFPIRTQQEVVGLYIVKIKIEDGRTILLPTYNAELSPVERFIYS